MRMPTLATDPTIKQEKEIRGKQFGKEKVKLSLYADAMVLYIEKSNDSIKNLLVLINEFWKVEGHRINIQKLLHFYALTANC